MAGLCEGGNEPPGSLKASKSMTFVPRKKSILSRLRISHNLRDIAQGHFRSPTVLGVQFKVCHGSLYAVMWLADEPREFNLPTLPQRCITYEAETLPSKYGVHSEDSVGRLAGLLIRSCVRAWVGSPFGLWFLPRFSPAVGLKPDGLWRVYGINPFDLITWLGFSELSRQTRWAADPELRSGLGWIPLWSLVSSEVFPAVGLKPDGLWRVLGINPFDLITPF
ncbi:hypothetical protein ANN_10435 [Periplaneta americana]|uniref:Uncharacterized protein n=1 Tax=Periplaneta americana TaxID=6978 RepID=A0ABQ8TP07_PERAM|nr:hypothetical protein ANN_10435 [Periplaneta americana]